MDIKQEIKTNRPNISDSSINTYNSILNNIFKKYKNEKDELNMAFFNNEANLIEKLKDVKPSVRKTLYSALIAITKTDNNKKYKEEMGKDAEHFKSDNLKQNKSEAQEKNWITQEEIKTKFNSMLKDVKFLWNKEDLNKSEKQRLQDVVIVALTSGIFIPPRRSLDWCEFVIDDTVDETKNNYMKKNKFYFNTYKGSDKKGVQEVDIPKPLMTILNKCLKVNKHKYLLVDSQYKKMNSVKLNQHLERIWGKKSGVNIFRHSFTSEKYPVINMEQLKKDAKDMGTSANMILETYVKKN